MVTQLIKKSLRCLLNPKVHCHDHSHLPGTEFRFKSIPLLTVLYCLYKLSFNIFITPTCGSVKWCVTLRLANWMFVCIAYVPHSCYWPNPSYPLWFSSLYIIWWRPEIVQWLQCLSCEVGGLGTVIRFSVGTNDLSFLGRVQACSVAHLAPYSESTDGLSAGVKRPRREADHLLPRSAEIKNDFSCTSTPPRHLNGV